MANAVTDISIQLRSVEAGGWVGRSIPQL